jgi:hypothetical protein
MVVRFIAGRATLALALMPRASSRRPAPHADTAAGPKDAKAIFNATLPQVAPGSDLRSLLTSSTRTLAIFGTIDRGNARERLSEWADSSASSHRLRVSTLTAEFASDCGHSAQACCATFATPCRGPRSAPG